MEQQRTAQGAERQLSELVEDYQFSFHPRLGDLSSLFLGLFLFQRLVHGARHALFVMMEHQGQDLDPLAIAVRQCMTCLGRAVYEPVV